MPAEEMPRGGSKSNATGVKKERGEKKGGKKGGKKRAELADGRVQCGRDGVVVGRIRDREREREEEEGGTREGNGSKRDS